MRGGTTTAIGWVLLELLLLSVPLVSAHRCDRTPEGHVSPKIPADNRFQLKISGSPDKYVPNEGYTISLQGLRSHGQVAAKFTGFMLVVEPQHHIPLRSLSPRDVTPRPVGTFQLYGDTLTKFSPSCPNMVTHTSSMPKSEVQVRWTAPPPGSGCVIFRATVIEHRDVWYQDDGPLSKMLCEEVQESHDTQPEVLEQCCACDEAKYEVTFEGLWSRHTHPKDFPSNSWLTRFSDVIGASHSSYYRFWEYGGIASEGLRQVAERGSTRMLESELKSQSQNIRTIIKARGISYPNVTGKTFAVFRVDRVHHLMSLVSMIDPSPDWIVGVSALELCLRNCSWVESKVLNLYPWDAGTDSGVTYISPDQQTVPRDKIRRITSSFPNDPKSPFYDPSGLEMKPLARLYLTRQRLYEKTCEDDPNPDDPCALSEWGPWSPCSATCGQGIQHRTRNFLKKGRNKCPRLERLSARKSCVVQYCRVSPQPNDDEEKIDPWCEVGEWGDWSRCEPATDACDRGLQKRYRMVKARGNYRNKYCLSIKTVDERECILSKSFSICPKNKPGNRVFFKEAQGSTCCADGEGGDNNEKPPDDYGTSLEDDYNEGNGEPTPECEMTSWSEWSPCSVSCGVGVTMRFRKLKNPPEEGEEPRAEYLRAPNNNNGEDDDDYGTDDQGFEGEPGEGEGGEQEGDVMEGEYATGACSLFKTREVMACNGSYPDCQFTSGEAQTPDPEEEGQSEGEEEEPTEEPAEDLGIQAGAQVRGYEGTERPVVDCKFSRWSPWSKCEASTCGQQGYKVRTRYIEIHAKNGGKDCTGKTRKQRKCVKRCKHNEEEEEEEERSEEKRRRHDKCRYSEWSEWSECTATCGYSAVRQRTRHVKEGVNCSDRLQQKACNVGLCPGH